MSRYENRELHKIFFFTCIIKEGWVLKRYERYKDIFLNPALKLRPFEIIN